MNIKFFSGTFWKEKSFDKMLATLEKQPMLVRPSESESVFDWDLKTI